MFDSIVKSKTLEYFFKWCSDSNFFDEMNTCFHSVDNKTINPFHLENSNWAHTMIVLKMIEDGHCEDDNIIRAISAISHDFGKVETRNEHRPGRISFFGHEKASVQPTVDFLYFLKDNNYFSENNNFEYIFKNVVYCVCYHLEIYKIEKNKISAFLNYDENLKQNLLALMYADRNGQFLSVERITNPNFSDNDDDDIFEFIKNLKF